MEYIKECLKSFRELYPLPVDPFSDFRTTPARKIKALIFDIYGTLLISGSGDVFSDEVNLGEILEVFRRSDIKMTSGNPAKSASEVLSLFTKTVEKSHREARAAGVAYPEIDIREIWDEVISGMSASGALAAGHDYSAEKISFHYEAVTNPVYPMPGMLKLIKKLAKKDKVLGVISNAQFYTPVIMNYFMTGKLHDGLGIEPFRKSLVKYSFLERCSKPELALFKSVRETLADDFGIAPEETLFIGNDMFKDIYPAAQAGFKTVLFAGDGRSLRLREDKPEVRGVLPDYAVNDLESIFEIIQ